MNVPLVSLIIPAYNEEASIHRVIESIHCHLNPICSYEIIVVDNGSCDNTVCIAEKHRTIVFKQPSGTIAELRNIGAKHAMGKILIFIDADVLLTDTWSMNFPNTIKVFDENPFIVTGSRCGISKAGSWIERYWFQPLILENAKYINSGHLITTKILFEQLRGFDRNLETGEDYDFSMRARSMGATIINNPSLYVIHEGYPKTLLNFMRREIWHGKGSYGSFQSILRSKTAIISIFFILLHLVSISGLILSSTQIIWSSMILTGLVCFIASALKFRVSFVHIVVNTFLYYCYFWGRGMAFLNTFIERLFPLNRVKRYTHQSS